MDQGHADQGPLDRSEDESLAFLERMLRECACLNLRKAARAVTLEYDRALEGAGVLSTQLPILVTVGLREPVSAAEVGTVLVMDRTAVSRSLSRLREMGLVDLAPGEDRRTREASLTSQGWEAIQKAIPLWLEAQERVVSRMGRDEDVGDDFALMLGRLAELATTAGE